MAKSDGLILLFDVDDTLLDFAKSERRAITRTLKTFGIEPTEELISAYSQINLACWKLIEDNKITRKQLDRMRFDILNERCAIEGKDSVAMGACYRKELSKACYVIRGCRALLAELSRTDRLFIVTNGAEPTQLKRLKKAGIDGFFEDIFYSESIGFSKPYREFFDYVAAHVKDWDAARAVLIGDSQTSDIAGANNAGITSVWFNRRKEELGDVKPDFTVKNYGKLKVVLSRLRAKFEK